MLGKALLNGNIEMGVSDQNRMAVYDGRCVAVPMLGHSVQRLACSLYCAAFCPPSARR
jgi:hypothetical protein